MLSSCADSLSHSQLLSCSVPCVPSFGRSFLLAVMGQTRPCCATEWLVELCSPLLAVHGCGDQGEGSLAG